MKRLFLTLEDGAVFEGRSVSDALETAGLLSFYTGVVGYQEVITDPANQGKIVLFTYPLIGNYGVIPEDAESASPKVSGIVTKEYPPYYSNFRATGSLADYLNGSNTVFGTAFDTRAILLHLREHGEMLAATSGEPLSPEKVRELAAASTADYLPENTPVAIAQARPLVNAHVIDLGASKSFYKNLAALGVDACCAQDKADLYIVSDAPYYMVESQEVAERVMTAVAGKPVIGFGHGSAIVAKARGAEVKRLAFGDHGVNIPVSYAGGGRNEITVQNHIYEVIPNGCVEQLFTNVHDNTCEGFVCKDASAAGVNFMPGLEWFTALMNAVGVK